MASRNLEGDIENSLAASVASAITDTSGSSVPATITAAAAGVVGRLIVLSSQDTSGLTAGRPIYLSTTGGEWLGALPAASNKVQVVGSVVTVHAGTGRVAIQLPGQIIPWDLANTI